MYASINYKTKKAFRTGVEAGRKVTLFAPGLGEPKRDGREIVEGPWSPQAHSWYASVEMKDGVVVKVR